jgi:hypothetical protein
MAALPKRLRAGSSPLCADSRSIKKESMLAIRNFVLAALVAVSFLSVSTASAAGYSFVEGYNVLDDANSPGIGALLGATSGLERDIAVDSARGIIYIARGQTTTADRSGGVIGISAIVITNGAQAGSNYRDTGLIVASGTPALGWCQSLAYDPVSDKLWVLGAPLSSNPNIFSAPGGSLGGAPNGGNPAAQNAALTRVFQVDTNLLDVGVYVSPTVSTNGVPARGGAPRGFAVRTVGTNTTVYLGMGNHVQAWSNTGSNGTWQRIWATQRPPTANTVATRVALTGFNGVNGVTVDDDGNCYFSVQVAGGRIWTVRPSLIEFVADPMSLDYNDLAFGGNNEREVLSIAPAATPLLTNSPQSLTFARFGAQKSLFVSYLPAAASRGITRLNIDNNFSFVNGGAVIAAQAVDGFGSGQPAGGQDTILSSTRLKLNPGTQPSGSSNGTLYHDVDSVTNPTYIYFNAFVTDTNKGQTIPTAAVSKVRIPADTNPPSILTQPQSQTLLEGGTIGGAVGGVFPLSVGASGAIPLYYQWQTNGVDIPGANSATLLIPNASTNQSGPYRVVVTNSLGSVTSSVATVTVNPLVRSDAMNLLWSNAPGSRPYLSSTDGSQRAIAFNPDSQHVLVVSRTPANGIYILDPNSGEDIGQLGLSGVSGGTFPINKIGTSDDGHVYVANLAQNGQDFRIYHWVVEINNDSPATNAYSGNPTGTATNRWGDTFDVRGSGNDIQIIAGTRSSNVFAIFTTTDNGDTFTATPITVSGAGANAFGLGLAFGAGNTVWAKGDGTTPLRLVQFDIAAGTGSVLRSYSSAQYVSTAVPLAVNPNLNLLASISIENPDNLRLYTTFNLANPPVLIDQELFPSDNDNVNVTGALDFGNIGGTDYLFAIDSNNGILAMTLGTIAQPPGAITITRTGTDVFLNWSGTFTLQSATNVTGPYLDVGPPGTSHTESTVGVPEKYFRLRN